MGRGSRLGFLGALFALLFTTVGCEEEEVKWSGPPPEELEKLREMNRARPRAQSLDRLPPGELLEGKEEFYGFFVPRGMTGVRKGPKLVEITGSADFDLMADYIKDRIAVRHAEMQPNQLVFRNAHIIGTSDKVFELTLSRQGRRTRLQILDVTKPPGTGGLKEDERWKRAGLKPGGGLIDPNAME